MKAAARDARSVFLLGGHADMPGALAVFRDVTGKEPRTFADWAEAFRGQGHPDVPNGGK